MRENMSNRIEWLDIAKGLGIFSIVIGHNAVPHFLHDWVYSFHVPLFFIISGYFYRARTWRDTLAKGWKQLLRPMLLTILVAQALMLFLYVRHGFWSGPPFYKWLIGVVTLQHPGYTRSMWFLMSLFWGKLLFRWINTLPVFFQPILVIILFSIGYFLHGVVEFIAWKFDCGLLVPFFLYIGTLLRRFNVVDHLSKAWFLAISVPILCFAWMFKVDLVEMSLPLGFLSVITMILISVTMLVDLKWFSERSSVPHRLFLYAGQNSLIILCVHSLIHTWQLDVLFWRSLPPIGNVHFVLGWGFVALAECVILVVAVYFLQKIPAVHRFFHSK